MGKDHTLFALLEGNVRFHKGLKGRTYAAIDPLTRPVAAG